MRERDLLSLDFPRIREILASFTQTPIGKEKARNLLPFNTQKEAEREFRRLEQIADFSFSGQGIKDIREELSSLKEGEVLSPLLILDIQPFLLMVKELKKLPPAIISPTARLRLNPDDLSQLARKIKETLDEQGAIREKAFPIFQKLGEEIRRQRALIISKLETIRKKNSPLFREGEITLRGGRYCLPLKASQKGRIDGIVHDLSETGHTLFIEPLSIVEMGNQLVRAEKRYEEEKRKILRELSEEIYKRKESLLALADLVGEIDLLLAKRDFGRYFEGVKPTFITEGAAPYLEIKGARHPLLLLKEKTAQGESPFRPEVVPLNLVMADKKILIVSGPNAGGKTCLLKTVGLMALLAQCGIFPPAQRLTIPFFQNIFTDIGEKESLEEATSAFTSHLLNIKEMLKENVGCSLFLLDEIGSATSPEEGSALALALIETLRQKAGIVIITTHLTNVKSHITAPDILLGGMEFKERPTYRLILGLPGESSALEIASLISFPKEIIDRARRFLGEDFLSLQEKIKKLEKEIQTYEELNRHLTEKDKEITELTSLLSQRIQELTKKEKSLRREILKEKERFLSENREKIERVILKIKEMMATKEAVAAGKELIEDLKRDIKSERERLVTHKGEIKVGTRVYIPRFQKSGQVIEIDKGEAKLLIGKVKVILPIAELEIEEVVPEESDDHREEIINFDPCLNIRGEEKVFALEKVERFLEDAGFYGVKELTIRHGKGEWVLRQAIWELLKEDQRVAEFREGRREEGGSGVTIVKLR